VSNHAGLEPEDPPLVANSSVLTSYTFVWPAIWREQENRRQDFRSPPVRHPLPRLTGGSAHFQCLFFSYRGFRLWGQLGCVRRSPHRLLFSPICQERSPPLIPLFGFFYQATPLFVFCFLFRCKCRTGRGIVTPDRVQLFSLEEVDIFFF